MTAEAIAEIRRQLANRGAVPCVRCKDSGTIVVRNGRAFITDNAEERAACWRDELCPQCGGIAIRAVGLLTELLDELDIDRAPLYTDRIENLERERDAALAGRTNHCPDAEQQVTRFTTEDEATAATERAEKAEAESGEWSSAAQDYLAQIATLTRERDEANEFFDKVKVESDTFRVETERLTRELEAERAGSVQYRQTLETIRFLPAVSNPKYGSLMHAVHLATQALEFSTAGAEMLERLRKYELNENQIIEVMKPDLFPGALSSGLGEAVMANLSAFRQNEEQLVGRLRKAEAENKRLRDDIATRPLNPSAVFTGFLQVNRITTLEAALSNCRQGRVADLTERDIVISQKRLDIEDLETALNSQQEVIDTFHAALEESRKALDTIPFDLMWTAGYPYAVTLSDGAFLQLRAAHERIGRLMSEGKP